ncbi:hypothetical protein [Piscinibacter koreensis]|uniref:Uncharacterized protein n=1 Tax=Piscinibacter koreensis TaxID=2742824 RepID=A0A7Y6NRG7_9BURK|nr:hypothetical protein [Schlegelella koreensis]NUZ07981.1 hypothetical protein [Schlegelella koreensis]
MAAPAVKTRAAPLRIEAADVEQVGRLTPGAALNFSVFGAPGASAQLQIEGAARPLALREVQPGIYEGTYTVGHADRIRPSSPVVATLRRGSEVARIALAEPLQLGAPRPAAGAKPAVPASVRVAAAGATAAAPRAAAAKGARKTETAAKPPPALRRADPARTTPAAPAIDDERQLAARPPVPATSTAPAAAPGPGSSALPPGQERTAAAAAAVASPPRGADHAPRAALHAGAKLPTGTAPSAGAPPAPPTPSARAETPRESTGIAAASAVRRDGPSITDDTRISRADAAGVARPVGAWDDAGPRSAGAPVARAPERIDLPPAVPDVDAQPPAYAARRSAAVPPRDRCADCDDAEPVRRAPLCMDCAVVESIRVVRSAADPRPGGLRGFLERRMQHHREMFGRLTGRPVPSEPELVDAAPGVAYDVVFRLPDGTRRLMRFDEAPPFGVGQSVRLLERLPAPRPRTLAAF